MCTGVKCPPGRDSGKTWTIRDWIVQNKDGTLFLSYPITDEDLNPAYNEGVCYLSIDYDYHANTDLALLPPNTPPPTKKDLAMSSVFKLVGPLRPRYPPLPIYTPGNALSPKDLALSLQLREMSTVENKDGTWSYVEEETKPRFEKPLVRSYGYGVMSIWPEDDEEWVLDEALRVGVLIWWGVCLAGVWGVWRMERVRRVVERGREKVGSWWLADIEDKMNQQLLNMGLVFGVIQIANKLNIDTPENTPYLRAAYLGVQLISLAVVLYIRLKVTAANDTTPLIYTEQKNPFDSSQIETHKTTHKDYDLSKIKESLTQQAVGVALIAFMHLKWGYTRPLLLQSVLGFRQIMGTQLFKIWVLGKPATGELNRPWKSSPFGGSASPAATPKELKAKEKKEQKKKISRIE
ncbi:hypothetical protein HDV00_012653 [Rhizophlyctis rosea]|nr:hypothetical protein HDV00_012653 [Rhizophlyctis rosea]